MLLPYLLALGVWTTSGANPPTAAKTISLKAALTCKARGHVVVDVRFAPTADLMAVVLQDSAFWDNRQPQQPYHIAVVSRDGSIVRQLAYEKPKKELQFQSLFWSPNSDYLALQTNEAISLIRVADGQSCGIRPGDALGFLLGPRFATSGREKEGRTIEVYGMDCANTEKLPYPSIGGPFGLASPSGDHIAFSDGFSILMTDARGEYEQSILKMQIQYNPVVQGFWFAEGGKVLCCGFRKETRCLDTVDGEKVGGGPEEGYRPPEDISLFASRGVWPIDTPTKADKVSGVLSMPGALAGQGGYTPNQGWLVWDFETGREILRLPSLARGAPAFGQIRTTKVALAPKGDCLAVAPTRGDSVQLFELPPK